MDEGSGALALRACEDALALEPGNPAAHYLIGSIHAQSGTYQAARVHLERAVALGADTPEAHIHLGNVYRLQGDLPRAAQSYRSALTLDPRSPLAHYSLAVVLKATGEREQVLAHLQHAESVAALRGEVVRMKVTTLIELARRDEAVAAGIAATQADPSGLEAAVALGFAYQKVHRPEDALGCYERALSLGRGDAELFNNYGIVLQDLGRLQEALASYDQALAMEPGHVLARFHRALACLLTGDYEAGWPDYETRLQSTEHPRNAAQYRRWHGNEPGSTVLTYNEQGLGDEIMFASCVPDLIASVRHCVIECSPKLHGLFTRSFPAATVYSLGANNAVPADVQKIEIDAEVPLGSLPLYYRRPVSSFPQHKGYLVADRMRTDAWRARLDALGPGLKVGVSWKGGTYTTRSPLRSISLSRLAPILRVPGVHFVSLQYTPDAPADIEALSADEGIEIKHWPEAISDYEETAALVSALDLTVTVCTAVVHLAGALGRPVWVAAPHSPEWRYGLVGETMPWYPSARIFRQETRGDWDPVVDALAERLRALTHEAAP